MKNYLNSSVRMLSLLVGVFIFGITWLLLSLFSVSQSGAWAVMAAVAAAVACAVFLALSVRARLRRYAGIEKSIPEQVLLAASASVSTRQHSRNGFLYLTADVLYGFFRDREPYTQIAINRFRVRRVKTLSPLSFEISMDAAYTFEVVCSETEN
ncbi:MAG: hypothetical protein WDA00_01230, partial [Eubacteriales bacterium]